MPNVQISDLPDAIIPLDEANTLFEVQTFEGGIPVARKVSADNLTFQSVGIQGLGVWDYVADIVAPPANGEVRYNNADPASATLLWIAETNKEGTDLGNVLNLFTAGSVIYVQDRTDNTKFAISEVTSYTDQGTYAEYGITNTVTQGAIAGTNQEVFIIGTGGGGGGGGLPSGSLGDIAFISTAPSTYSATSSISMGTQARANVTDIILELGGLVLGQMVLRGDPGTGNALFTLTSQTGAVNSGFQIFQVGANTNLNAAHNANPVSLDAVLQMFVATADGIDRNMMISQAKTDGTAQLEFQAPTNRSGNIELRIREETATVFSLLGTGFPTTFEVEGTNSDGARIRVGHPVAGTAGIGIEAGNDSGGADLNSYIRQLEASAGNWTNTTKNWIQFERDAGVILHFNDLVRIRTTNEGGRVDGISGNDGIFELVNDTGRSGGLTSRNNVGGIALRGGQTGNGVISQMAAGSQTYEDTWMVFDRNGGVHQYFNNVDVTRSVAAASGGLEVNNASTGAGFERVLTTADLGGGSLGSLSDVTLSGVAQGDGFFRGATDWNNTARFRWLTTTGGQFRTRNATASLPSAGAVQQGPVWFLDNSAGNALAAIGFNHLLAANFLRFENFNAGADTRFFATTAGNVLTLAMTQTAIQQTLHHSGAGVARTLTAANGGFEANNTSTGGGFERVLTTSDLATSTFLTDVRTTNLALTSATLTNALSVSLLANTRYTFEACLVVTVNTADDFAWDLVEPTGATINGLSFMRENTSPGESFKFTQATTTNHATSGSVDIIVLTGTISTAGTAASLTLRAAKQANTGADGTLFNSSWMRVQQL